MPFYNSEEIYNGAIIVCPECKAKGYTTTTRQISPDIVNQMANVCKTCNGKRLVKIRFEQLMEAKK